MLLLNSVQIFLEIGWMEFVADDTWKYLQEPALLQLIKIGAVL